MTCRLASTSSSTVGTGLMKACVTPLILAALTSCITPPVGTSLPTIARTPTTVATSTRAAASAASPSLAATPTHSSRPTQEPDLHSGDWELFYAGIVETEQDALNRLGGMSQYQIDLRIADDLLHLQGHEEIRYTNQEDVSLDVVYCRLFPNWAGGSATVSSVMVDGQDVKSTYEFDDSALRVQLQSSLQPGEETVIEMDFEVQMAQEMAGNYGLFGYFEDVLVLDKVYPVIPVYDDEGWNVEVPPPNADASYFDASLYLVRVTAPADLVIVASGIGIGRDVQGDSQVLTFAAGPARDFYLAASEKFEVISATVGHTQINSYAFDWGMDGAELALRVAVDALKSFNQRLGVYPYTEFDVVSTPMLALGIEYPGIVGMTLSAYDLDAEVAGLPAPVILESSVAHEVAHQWFYNVIGNDQVDEPWLDEALAQYATWLYFIDAYGEASAQGYRGSWEGRWNRVGGAEIPIGLPAAAYEPGEYGAIVYGRGPIFVAALAEEMGQDVFDSFLRDYYETHTWGIATGDSFKTLAEQHCQCDLTALFEQWVYER